MVGNAGFDFAGGATAVGLVAASGVVPEAGSGFGRGATVAGGEAGVATVFAGTVGVVSAGAAITGAAGVVAAGAPISGAAAGVVGAGRRTRRHWIRSYRSDISGRKASAEIVGGAGCDENGEDDGGGHQVITIRRLRNWRALSRCRGWDRCDRGRWWHRGAYGGSDRSGCNRSTHDHGRRTFKYGWSC